MKRLPLPPPSDSLYKRLASALVALTAAALACNAPSRSAATPTQAESAFPLVDAIYEEAGVSLDDALAQTPEDQRQAVLAQLGPPDAFSLEWQELEGQLVRWEEWSYFDYQSRFDFVDGELLWTLDIDPAPDGSIYAHAFDPLAFEAGMSMAEAKAQLPDLSFTELPLDEADLTGGVLLASDQILLGFDQDLLVYVQTFMLAPEGDQVGEAEGQAPQPPSSQTTSAPQPTATTSTDLLYDRFDDPAKTASPLFGPETMGFDLDQGAGVMTAHSPAVLVATYASPSVADFQASLSMQWLDPQPGSGAGFIFRSDDPAGGLAHFYLVLVQPADGHVALERFRDGQLVEVEGTPLIILTESPAAPIALSVTARGEYFTVDVNGIPTLVVQDDGLASPGIVGLAMISPVEGDQVLFDELRVEALHE